MKNYSNTRIHEHINAETYVRFIETAKKNRYAFVSFAEIKNYEKFIILRHDIDLDLQYALRMAQLESDNGVRGTYFIMLHNALYNPWSANNAEIFAKIRELGHHLGLHFDPGFYVRAGEPDLPGLKKVIAGEIDILKKITGYPAYYVSFHQPPGKYLDKDLAVKGVFESAYNKAFFTDIRYIADSAGRWREESILELVRKNSTPRIQFLSHPALWFDSGEEILRQRLARVLECKKALMEREFREAINNYRQEIILYE